MIIIHEYELKISDKLNYKKLGIDVSGEPIFLTNKINGN